MARLESTHPGQRFNAVAPAYAAQGLPAPAREDVGEWSGLFWA
jgi:hypothetical protein